MVWSRDARWMMWRCNLNFFPPWFNMIKYLKFLLYYVSLWFIISTWLVITYIYLYNLDVNIIYILLLKWLPCQLWESEPGLVMLSCFRWGCKDSRDWLERGLRLRRPKLSLWKILNSNLMARNQLIVQLFVNDEWMMNGSVWRWRLDNPGYSSVCKESKNHRIRVGLVKP